MKNGKFIKISKQLIVIKKLLFIFVVFMLAVGCTRPCSEQAKEYIKEAEELFDDWDDANRLAGTTSRIALSPVIARLQEIRREASNLQVPECAEKVNDVLLDYMDKTIDGYIAFMSKEDDDKVNDIFDEAGLLLDRFMEEFIALEYGKEPYD